MSWGGKQPLLRKSTVVADSLGNFDVPAKMFYIPDKGSGQWKNGPKWVGRRCRGARELDLSLKTGDVIHNVFQPDDPPPWYDLKAPRYARPRTSAETAKETARRNKLRENMLRKKRLKDPLATLSAQEEEQVQTRDTSKYPLIQGQCVGVFVFFYLYAVCNLFLFVACFCRLRWIGQRRKTDALGKRSMATRSHLTML